MTITRLKERNQITLPKVIMNRLSLKKDELFQVDVKNGHIILVPVEIKPKYTAQDLAKVDKIVSREKKRAKVVKVGAEFGKYIDTIK